MADDAAMAGPLPVALAVLGKVGQARPNARLRRLESGIEGVVVPLPERDDAAHPSDNAAVA